MSGVDDYGFGTRAVHAGLTPDQIPTGAVILTGAALERANARAVADLFAGSGGKFVCASAGHNLESILAAHGSGAVAGGCDGTVDGAGGGGAGRR